MSCLYLKVCSFLYLCVALLSLLFFSPVATGLLSGGEVKSVSFVNSGDLNGYCGCCTRAIVTCNESPAVLTSSDCDDLEDPPATTYCLPVAYEDTVLSFLGGVALSNAPPLKEPCIEPNIPPPKA